MDEIEIKRLDNNEGIPYELLLLADPSIENGIECIDMIRLRMDL